MTLGLLCKIKKKRALAINHLTEAKRILSPFGQSPTLAQLEAALAELGGARLMWVPLCEVTDEIPQGPVQARTFMCKAQACPSIVEIDHHGGGAIGSGCRPTGGARGKAHVSICQGTNRSR